LMVIPAIDLIAGKVVRLKKGDSREMSTYTRFGDPIAVARRWEEEGAEYLHVVDLDAALSKGDNKTLIMRMVEESSVPVQAGGGIRSLSYAKELLDNGVDRVMLGSLAIERPEIVEDLLEDWGKERVMIALDHADGRVLYKGWKNTTNIDIMEALGAHIARGAEWFLVTAVEKDGTMTGPSLRTLERMADADARIVAAGGVGDLEDLALLRDTGVDAAVVGKALYEERFTLREAIANMKGGEA
jgi:phosphoribosylformimino-5-aminoimidazole carboxamide ribotide isomerase